MLRRSLAFLVPAVLLIACSSASPSGSTPESQGGGESSAPSQGGESSVPSQGGESSAPSQAGGGNGMASVDLTITGGDRAGHYQADIIEGGCASGTQGPNTFTVASVTLDPDTNFDGPQLFLYDAAAAAGGDDAMFSAAFVFDNYNYTVEVNPYLSASQNADFGSGTATLDNRGSTATITIEGTTANGETVSATIECHAVTNF
jgi:hypothetical protein